MKKYVSPEAIKVNFEANDIITVSSMLISSNWTGWGDGSVKSVTWTDLLAGGDE